MDGCDIPFNSPANTQGNAPGFWPQASLLLNSHSTHPQRKTETSFITLLLGFAQLLSFIGGLLYRKLFSWATRTPHLWALSKYIDVTAGAVTAGWVVSFFCFGALTVSQTWSWSRNVIARNSRFYQWNDLLGIFFPRSCCILWHLRFFGDRSQW